MHHWLKKYRDILLYGACLALLLLALRWAEYRFLIISSRQELYTGFIALVFTGLGIWLTLKLAKPKKETVIVERKVEIIPSPATVTESDVLSKRELEVLQLMASGMSNAEIAEQLFVSLNTVKTHSSKIYEKLDVKRRTQAVEKAKLLNIIS
ncbi:response regulator transcription factor [Flavobacterium sp. RHBU_3]|uniref:response regulator transcription factor n=1 Tax=Flavobacterium sp. RHBU_3 TaxID=3391184 RepID=UPI003984B3F4